jgi:uncharacterized membrane protein YbhN (UPF0104 family)
VAIGAKVLRKWLIRAIGSAVALGLIFWFLPKDAILAGFSRLSLPVFLSVLLAFLACHLVTAAKWWMLMDRAIPLPTALRAHFAGLAANLCLPGAAGGDAVRAALAHATLKDGPKVAAAAIGDRLIDLVGLACLTLIGLALLHGGGSTALGLTVAGIVFAAALAGLFIFPKIARGIWGRWPDLPARELAFRLADAFAALGRRPGLLLFALVLSAAVQAVLILLSIRLAEPMGVHVAWAAWFFAWPIAKIVATLPISLGGLGVRESSLAAMLATFGASAPEVVASGLAWQGILYLAGAIGALILIVSGGGFGVWGSQVTELSE